MSLSKDLQHMVKLGLLNYSVDENGEFLFFLTPAGRQAAIRMGLDPDHLGRLPDKEE
jgi:hypothetical protein